jgi:hypothetical protein
MLRPDRAGITVLGVELRKTRPSNCGDAFTRAARSPVGRAPMARRILIGEAPCRQIVLEGTPIPPALPSDYQRNHSLREREGVDTYERLV